MPGLASTLNELARQIFVNEEGRYSCDLFFNPTHPSRKVQGLLDVGPLKKWIRLPQVLYGIPLRNRIDDHVHGKSRAPHHGLPREHVGIAFNLVEGRL